MEVTWRRADDGYRSADGRLAIHDNGPGRGPSRGSGRWAVEVDGRWLVNADTLAEAKRLAGDQLRCMR